VPTHGPQDDVALKMPLFEIVGHGMSLLRVRGRTTLILKAQFDFLATAPFEIVHAECIS